MSLTGIELIPILPKLKKLASLDISSNNEITEINFIKLIQSVLQLKKLNVASCEGLKEALPAALKLLPDLTELVIGDLVQNEELVLTLQSVPTLKYLTLFGRGNKLNFIIKALKALPELEILNEGRILGFTKNEKMVIQELYPNIRSFEKFTTDGASVNCTSKYYR